MRIVIVTCKPLKIQKVIARSLQIQTRKMIVRGVYTQKAWIKYLQNIPIARTEIELIFSTQTSMKTEMKDSNARYAILKRSI